MISESYKSIEGKVGIGFRPVHYQYVTEHLPDVPWFEVITENFMGGGGRPRRYLEALRRHYPIVFHGVGLSLGSVEPLDQSYLKQWRDLILAFDPVMVSDHLCWTSHKGHNTHDLLPVPYSKASLEHFCAKVSEAQEFIKRPILIENPSAYIAFAQADWDEVEFLAELTRRTGCKLLLDLNNLYVNHRNVGLDPINYLERIPSGAVAQFHLAGHTVRDDVLIDTHDHDICAEVWELYHLAAKRWPLAPTLIEWDDKIPEFSKLRVIAEAAETHRTRELDWTTQGLFQKNPSASAPPSIAVDHSDHKSAADSTGNFANKAGPSSFELIQERFIAMVVNSQGVSEEDESLGLLDSTIPVQPYVGANVYNQAYFLRIKDCLKSNFPSLWEVCEDAGFSALVAGYLIKLKPSGSNIKEVGAGFSDFIRSGQFDFDFGVDPNVLGDIALIEWTESYVFDLPDDPSSVGSLEAQKIPAESWDSAVIRLKKVCVLVKTAFNIEAIMAAISLQEPPPCPEPLISHFLIYRRGSSIVRRAIGAWEFQALTFLQAGVGYLEALERTACGFDQDISDILPNVSAWMTQWLSDEIIREIVVQK